MGWNGDSSKPRAYLMLALKLASWKTCLIVVSTLYGIAQNVELYAFTVKLKKGWQKSKIKLDLKLLKCNHTACHKREIS